MAENPRLLHELEVLEVRRIADLAAEARRIRDLLLEKVPEADLGEPVPAHGERDPAGSLALSAVLATKPEYVVLRQAVAQLPRNIREKLWAVMQVGRGNATILDWDDTLATASALSDADLADTMVAAPDLHTCLQKGLYELGVATLPGDGG